MRVLNEYSLTKRTNCSCGAELEYTKDDVKHSGDNFRHEYEDYIICPNCGRKIIMRSGSHCAIPYD